MARLSVTKASYGFVVGIDDATNGSLITLEREINEKVRPVKGVEEITFTGEPINVIDYTALQNATISYRLKIVTKFGVETTEWFETNEYLDFGGDLLFSAPQPENRMIINVESYPQQEYEIDQTIVKVLGRPDPIVVSNTRQYAKGKLNLLTFSDEDRRSMMSLLTMTDVIGFSPHQSTYGFDQVHYFAVGNVVEERLSPRPWEPTRRWELEVQRVEPVRPEKPIITEPVDPTDPTNPTAPIVGPPGETPWLNWVDRKWVELAVVNWQKVAGL